MTEATVEPLIFTSLGNMPLSSLEERVVWQDSADETVCNIEHWYQGDCVRRQVNILKRTGNSVLGSVPPL
jgi:hypothetical protein